MTNSSSTDKDPRLWKIARKRVGFKSHLVTYLAVNCFLWILWFVTSSPSERTEWPWPLWPTLGWGLGVFFNYIDAYVYPEENSAEREYEKLKRKQHL